MKGIVVFGVALAAVACGEDRKPGGGFAGAGGSGGDPGGGGQAGDAAAPPDGAVADAGPRQVTLSGIVRELDTTEAIPLNGTQVFQLDRPDAVEIANNEGFFELLMTANQPAFVVARRGNGYTQVILSELQLGLDLMGFRDLRLPADARFDQWTAAMPGYDAQKGVVRIEIRAHGSGDCSRAAGAQVLLDPPEGTVVYAAADTRLPDPALGAAAGTDSLGYAYVHGVPAGTYSVIVSKPGCVQEGWPVNQPSRRFTGRLQVEPGRSVALGFGILRSP